MEIFKSKKQKSQSELINEKDENKSLVNSVIEMSLQVAKKYYEVKSKIVNEASKIEPEWEFYDDNINQKEIDSMIVCLEEGEKQINTLMSEIDKCKRNLKEYDTEISRDNLIIDNYNESSTNVENEKNNRLLLKLNNKREKVTLDRKKQQEINNKEKLCEEIKLNNQILAYKILKKMSLIRNSYDRCIEFAQENNVLNSYVNFGLLAIKYYEEKDREKALEYASYYYKNRSEDSDNIAHPILTVLYSEILISQKLYEEAKIVLDDALKMFPQSIQIHKILYKIHTELNEVYEQQLEKDIITLLS